jgi:P4 family phage/plasmid primase-like protien
MTSQRGDLNCFLESKKVNGKLDPYTHTSIFPSSCYKIEDTKNFFTLYCNYIHKKNIATIGERPLGNGPLRIDFDLKADASLKHRQYTLDIVILIIKQYQELIQKVIKIPDEKISTCILLEKPEPRTRDGIVVDGFHLHFPFFICESWMADGFLRKEIIQYMRDEQIWSKTKYLESSDKFVDSCFTKNWLMYGSAKATSLQPFLFSKVFAHGGKETKLETVFENEIKDRKNSILYYLPIFLSIRHEKVSTLLNNDTLETRIEFSVKKKIVSRPSTRKTEEIIYDLKTIKEGRLMEMISSKRADNYSEWIDIGWILFCIGDGCEEALNMWIEFSKNSDKFKNGVCEKQWEKMEVKNKTIGSLFFIIKEDSPTKFAEWKKRNVDFLISECLRSNTVTEYDVAKVVIKILDNKFICCGSKHNIWYTFDDGRWREFEDAVFIKRLLPTEVLQEFDRYKKKLFTRDREDDDEHKEVKTLILRCSCVIIKLKTTIFQEKIIKMCKTLTYDPRFLDRLDENYNLFGCENGVIDLELGIFREGRADDYISFSCATNYKSFSYEDEEVIELNSILQKIFVNEKIRNYFLDFMATCLRGGNSNKIIMMFLGPTNGGKSTIVDLIYHTFGDYAKIFPRELFIKPSFQISSSQVRPELTTTKGIRLGMGHELTKDDKINVGEIKMLSGNDTVTARTFHKEPIQFKPQFTMISQMNSLPQIPSSDTAMWERVKILMFGSVFNNLAPEDIEQQFEKCHFKVDLTLKERIKHSDCREPFLWMLFERFKKLYCNGEKQKKLVEPNEVKATTEMHREQSNVFKLFVKDKLEKSDTVLIKLTELYNIFKDWYIVNYPNYREKIGKLAFKDEMIKELGTMSGKTTWTGYRIVNTDDEDFK